MRICRVCGESLLAQTRSQSLEKYASIYFHLTAIELTEHEDPSQCKICGLCIEKLEDFDRFRKVCLEVHWRLHKIKFEPLDEDIHEESIAVECKTEVREDDELIRSVIKQKDDSESGSSDEEEDDDDDENYGDGADSDSDEEAYIDEDIVAAELALIPKTESGDSDSDEAIVKPKKKRAKWGSLKKERKEPIQIYSCDQCPKKFRVIMRLNAHKRTHEGLKPFACELCGKDFAKWNNLKTHRIQKHSDNKIALPCMECGQTFATKQGLKRHRQRNHDPNYVAPEPISFMCDTCGKTFTTNGTLKKHKYIHTPNEMPFVCDICEKKFPTSHKLKEHTMRHEGVKNHTCPYCGLRKTTMHELRTHMKNVHSKSRTIPCDFCTTMFANMGNLNRHVKIVHLGVKPYNCTVCDRAFGKSDHLKRHMKSHNRTGGGGAGGGGGADHIPDLGPELPPPPLPQPPQLAMIEQAE